MLAVMRRLVAAAVLCAVAACASSEDALNPQPLPPGDERSPVPGGSSGGCSGSCCDRPDAGTRCDGAVDDTCSWGETCPTGLVTLREMICTTGQWQVTSDCPAEGDSDARGCPARQPENGAPCSVSIACGYVLPCAGYRKTASATCSGNVWATTPLGVCD